MHASSNAILLTLRDYYVIGCIHNYATVCCAPLLRAAIICQPCVLLRQEQCTASAHLTADVSHCQGMLPVDEAMTETYEFLIRETV